MRMSECLLGAYCGPWAKMRGKVVTVATILHVAEAGCELVDELWVEDAEARRFVIGSQIGAETVKV